MKQYEYNDVTVQIPTGWHEVTVGTYDRMWTIKPTNARERASVVAIACGVDLQVLLDWPTEVFNMILRDVDFLFNDNPVPHTPVVEINGAQFLVAIEDKLTLGEYIDVDHVQKNSDAILSNVLAIVCRPAGEKYDPDNNDARAKMFGALAVSQVQGVLAFFLLNYQTSTQLMRLCANLQAMVDLLPRNIAPLLRRGAFIRLSRIWLIMKYYFLTRSLRARSRKFSHFYYTNATRHPQN